MLRSSAWRRGAHNVPTSSAMNVAACRLLGSMSCYLWRIAIKEMFSNLAYLLFLGFLTRTRSCGPFARFVKNLLRARSRRFACLSIESPPQILSSRPKRSRKASAVEGPLMPISIKRLVLLLLALGPLHAYLKQDFDLTGFSGEHSHRRCVCVPLLSHKF